MEDGIVIETLKGNLYVSLSNNNYFYKITAIFTDRDTCNKYLKGHKHEGVIYAGIEYIGLAELEDVGSSLEDIENS